ncbi:hypothetical protein OG801_13020 [Nocardioides sp. NBC_00163]|uniref:hypothetical protein n=1 Tax=Nocardioides sp. NBC_00163 TaxID=2975999 RepID=UPI0032529FC6
MSESSSEAILETNRHSRVVTLAAGLILALAAVAAPMIGAQSAEAATTYSRSFTTSQSKTVANRCVRVTLSGTMLFQRKVAATHGISTMVVYVNRKVTKPRVRVYTYAGPCTTKKPRRSIAKLSVTQRWSDHSCNGNLSVSVGFPWGVSVGASPTCGREERAHRSATYGRSSAYDQKNTDTTIRYANKGSITHNPAAFTRNLRGDERRIKLCQSAVVSMVIYPSASSSDSWSPTFRPCVKYW